jgi:DnaJ-class molecular chaperone
MATGTIELIGTDPCERCHALGWRTKEDGQSVRCEKCGGSGRIPRYRARHFTKMPQAWRCDHCGFIMHSNEQPTSCQACSGDRVWR